MANFTFESLPLVIQEEVKQMLCTQHNLWVDLVEGEYQIRCCAVIHNGEYPETLEVKAYEVMTYGEWREGYQKEFGYPPYGNDREYYGK